MTERPAYDEHVGLINNLVTQFGSMYDCFRELAQNSIDAGSSHVAVWTEFESGADHIGVIKVCVEDSGAGMDESIIDNQLTTLFSSSKEDDLTKIGKFGIGFVSIFAMKPQAVLLQTGRAGEYWELIFREDRSFTKSPMEDPVEGTTVTLFIPGDFRTHQEIAENTLKSLKRWCRHARVEITFENRTPRLGERVETVVVNEPFEALDADCIVTFEEEGTRIACGYSARPSYGMFNAGLTLAESPVAENLFRARLAQRLSQIAVKIESRYLEHTLSRDTVMQDEGWERACAILKEVVETRLTEKLVQDLVDLVAQPTWTLESVRRYGRLLRFLASEPPKVLRDANDAAIFRDIYGRGWTPDELWSAYRKDGRLLVTEAPSLLTDRLNRIGVPVLLGRQSGGEHAQPDHALETVPEVLALMLGTRKRRTVWGTLRAWFTSANLIAEASDRVAAPEVAYLPVEIDDAPPEAAVALLADAQRLLDAVDAGYTGLTTFVPAVALADPPFFVTGRQAEKLMAHPPPSFEQKAFAAVNRQHAHFRRLQTQYAVRPQMAAYCLAKALLLAQDQQLHQDLQLIAFAQELA